MFGCYYSLYSKNKVRPLNENSTRICEIAIKFWDEYKNHHIHDDIQTTNANIILRQLYMRDIFFAMNVAEEAKKIIAQSQNTTNP